MTRELLEAIQHTRQQQHVIKDHIEEVRTKVVALWEEKESQAGFYPNIIQNLTDQQSSTAAAKEIFSDKKYDVHYSLRGSNKMPVLLDIVKTWAEKGHDISYLTNQNLELGRTLPQFRQDKEWIDEGYKSTLWGTSALTKLSATLTAVDMAITSKNISQYSLKSSIHHVAPLKEGMQDVLPQSLWNYQADGKLMGYGFVHSGFAYGGSRFQTALYPDGKEWKPEDASSYIKEYMVPKNMTSWKGMGCTTTDFLCVKKTHFHESGIPETWQASPDAALAEHFDVIEPENAMPGDIWVTRRGISDQQLLGRSGAAGIVTEVKGSKVDIIQANSDMPYMEGIGIGEQDRISDDPSISIFYLRRNDATLLHEAFTLQNLLDQVDAQMQDYEFSSVYVVGQDAADQADIL